MMWQKCALLSGEIDDVVNQLRLMSDVFVSFRDVLVLKIDVVCVGKTVQMNVWKSE